MFCREIFLDKANDFVEKGFWLCKILKPWPLVFQARLLYILYGPVNDDNGKVALVYLVQSSDQLSFSAFARKKGVNVTHNRKDTLYVGER